MNKAFAVLLISISTSFGQGTLNFNNDNLGAGIDAPIFDVGGITKLGGTAFFAQLYAGPSSTSIAPIGAAVTFLSGAGAGYINVGTNSTRTVSTVAPGNVAFVVVRAWDATFATYEIASTTPGAKAGESTPVLMITTGGLVVPPNPPTFPANLVGLTSFSLAVVPEPSAFALGALGVVGLICLRRRNS